MSSIRNARLAVATGFVIAGLASPPVVHAGVEPFIGEIMWVGFNFCPRGFAELDGQLLSISQNTALFSLLGTMYGGDGATTFALPDLRGRTMVHVGLGLGLSIINQGEVSGAEDQTLTFAQMPAHSHTATTTISDLKITSTLRGSSQTNQARFPTGKALGAGKANSPEYVASAPSVNMAAGSVRSSVTGGTATTTVDSTNSGGTPVPVRDPFVGLKACMAVEGIYPSRP